MVMRLQTAREREGREDEREGGKQRERDRENGCRLQDLGSLCIKVLIPSAFPFLV